MGTICPGRMGPDHLSLVLEGGNSVFCVLICTVEPPNNGHVGDVHFVHCLEVVPSRR